MISEVDVIAKKIEKLSTEEALLLFQRIKADLGKRNRSQNQADTPEPQGLIYGEFSNNGRRMSTEEDFKLAEYHFNEDDWK